MASCGRHVGLAFQTSDDLLDVGNTAVTGKPRGIDLRDGNPSLPIVLGLAIDPELRRLFKKRRLEPAEVEQGITRIRRSGVLAEVAAATTRHVEAALAEIARLPQSTYRTMLETLAQGLGDRPT